MNVKQTTLRRDLQRQSWLCPVLWVEVDDDSVTVTRISHFYPIGSVQVFSSIWAGLKSARRAVLCAYWPSSSSLFVRAEWPPSALRFQRSARFGGKWSCLCVNTLKDILTYQSVNNDSTVLFQTQREQRLVNMWRSKTRCSGNAAFPVCLQCQKAP